MATTSNSGSYEQYKNDTARFIFWLVITARDFGYAIDDPALLLKNTPEKSGRLKGAARKAAAKQPAPLVDIAAPKKKYSINTEVILELAEFIGRLDMTISMPKFVWYSYKRAVKTRQKYAERYATGELTNVESNDGHYYFLWVLKRCREILEAKVKVQSVARPATQAFRNVQRNTSSTSRPATAPAAAPMSAQEPVSPAVSPDHQILADEAAAAEAENEAKGHLLDELARKLECDWKAKEEEDLALRKSCLSDDMRDILEQLEFVYKDTHKDIADEGYMNETWAVLKTEAAIDLIRHEELSMIQHAEENDLEPFDACLESDEFFGKTARCLAKIETARREGGTAYIFLVPRPSGQQIAADDLHTDEEYEFLVHYLQEASLEVAIENRYGGGYPYAPQFELPLLKTALDTPTSIYASMGIDSECSMTTVFVAELMRKIRSRDKIHSTKRYSPLLVGALKKEDQLIKHFKADVKLPSTVHDASESVRTLRHFIFDRPFSKARYIEMRQLNTSHPMCGIQHDYPEPRYRDRKERDDVLAYLDLKRIPNHAGNAGLRQACYNDVILPPKDGEFLRLTIPTMRGKLSLVHLLLYEEVGLGFANASPQIFAMSHLYNCLVKLGKVKGDWPDLQQVAEWHIDTIFLNEIPERADQFYSRLLLAAGFSPKAINRARDLTKDPDRVFEFGQQTHKFLWMKVLPLIQILRDYIHGRDTRMRTWYRLDEELSKTSGITARTQDNGDINIISFIKQLRATDQFRQLLPRLEFDYINLTLQCGKLFHKIDVTQEEVGIGGPAKAEAIWNGPTLRGFALTAGVLGDLDRIRGFKARGGKASKDIEDTTPIVDAAIGVMQEFLD